MTETTTDNSAMEADVKDIKSEVKTEDEIKSEVKTEDEIKSEVKTDTSAKEADVKDIKSEVKTEPANGVTSEPTESTDGKKKEATESSNDLPKEMEPEQIESSLDDAIIQQIHYYFGDLNLLKDKFLQEQVQLDDGWVPLKVLLTFNRLKDLSKEPKVIVAALKKASKPLIEISEDETKIRRSPDFPLPEMTEEWRKSVHDRTVYSKGFPTTGVALDELLKFFKQFGQIDNVQKRTLIDRKSKEEKKVIFKGSVFVTFQNAEDAAKYLALESVKFGDTELLRKAQTTYWNDKKAERDERWGRKTKGKDEKSSKPNKYDKKTEDKVAECPRGCIVHLTGFPKDPIERDAIREKIADLGGDVAYITYNRGDEEAFIRLQGGEENPAVKLVESLPDKVVKIGATDLAARVLEGDEETEFLKKSLEDRDKRRGNNRRGRQGRNSFRGRKRQDNSDGGPPAKKAAVGE